jgi:hypothetical protein
MALSLPRRFVCDLLHSARHVPLVTVERRMQLGVVCEARQLAQPRPGWCALFTKAHALVAAAWPALRRAFMSFPWPHLYQHAGSVAVIPVERSFGSEPAIFFARITDPETRSLAQLHHALKRCREDPLETVAAFRRDLRLSWLPLPLRRLRWWWSTQASGQRRAAFLGTFGVNTLAGLGAAPLQPLLPLTSTLSYGVLDDDGCLDVRLSYDPRVLDGPTAARILADLERALTHEVLAELRYLEGLEQAA